MSENVFKFTINFQVKILAAMCRDRNFLGDYRELIRPGYFENPVLMDLCRIIYDVNARTETVPSVDYVENEVSELIAANPKRAESRELFSEYVEKMRSADLFDIDLISEKVVAFAKRKAVYEALEKSVDLYKSNEYDKIIGLLEEANLTGSAVGDDGINLFNSDVPFQNKRQFTTISTGLPSLDKILKGGFGTGELVVVEAPTNGFKTGAICNFGTAALRAGCNVVHISLEVDEAKVARRYFGTMLGVDPDTCTDEMIKERIALVEKSVPGVIKIKSFVINTATTADIRAYIRRVVAKEFNPNTPLLIIVDYPDIMKTTNVADESRNQTRRKYADMIGIAREFDCPVLAPAQTNRATEKKKLITKADLAECYAIAMDAHIILSLNQTLQEQQDDEMRVFVAKSRESEAFKYVTVRVDKSATLWTEEFSDDDPLEDGEDTTGCGNMNDFRNQFTRVI